MTFEELFEEYTRSQGFRKLATRSQQSYMYSGDKLVLFFKEKPISRIKRSDLMRYQNAYSNTPALANMVIRVASVVFGFALDMDYISFNPAARMKKLKIGSHVKWTVDEVKAVIGLRDPKISTAVALAWYTGQREEDVLSMRWRDFDGEYIKLTQSKTKLEMKIKAHPDLAKYLNKMKWAHKEDHYIVSGETKRMSGSSFRNMLKRRTKKLHINKVFHGIRKGVASSLAEKRTSIKEIAAIMGHKTLRMAAFYSEQAESKILTDNAVDNLESCI